MKEACLNKLYEWTIDNAKNVKFVITISRRRLGAHRTTLLASSSHARVSLESFSSTSSVRPFMSKKFQWKNNMDPYYKRKRLFEQGF